MPCELCSDQVVYRYCKANRIRQACVTALVRYTGVYLVLPVVVARLSRALIHWVQVGYRGSS